MFLSKYTYILSLVWRDICFEKKLSLCMIFSLGAIFTPLFILLGLQEGIIGNMLDKLQRDPLSRLVTPKYPLKAPLVDAELLRIEEKAGVVISSPTSHVLLNIAGQRDDINTIPTNEIDPLFIDSNLAPITQENQIALSQSLARKLIYKIGDSIELLLIRYAPNKEEVRIPLTFVSCILESIVPDDKIWIHKSLFNKIYDWRKGWFVEGLGEQGKVPELEPSFDGILVSFDSNDSFDDEFWRRNTGRIPFATTPNPSMIEGLADSGITYLRWTSTGKATSLEDIKAHENGLYTIGLNPMQMVPYVKDISVNILIGTIEQEYKITIIPDYLISETINTSKTAGAMPSTGAPDGHNGATPNDSADVSQDTITKRPMYKIYVAKDDMLSVISTTKIILEETKYHSTIAIPVAVIPLDGIQKGYVAVDKKLAGQIHNSLTNNVFYDDKSSTFLVNTNSNRFFRSYASDIESIQSLLSVIQTIGQENNSEALKTPHSKINDVLKITMLAQHMTSIYLFIVLITGISGASAIASNVYAGVERRRYDLAYLSLLGVPQRTIYIFPVAKSLSLIMAGLSLAYVFYFCFGFFVDMFFASALGQDSSLTRLHIHNVMALFGGILCVGTVVSLVAASSVTSSNIGKYLHE